MMRKMVEDTQKAVDELGARVSGLVKETGQGSPQATDIMVRFLEMDVQMQIAWQLRDLVDEIRQLAGDLRAGEITFRTYS